MRVKEQTVYQFDELTDQAKERARDWYRRGACEDAYWSESVLEDAARICGLLGIELQTKTVQLVGGGTREEPVIYWSGFGSQGDGACFEGTYGYRKGSTAAVREYAPQDEELGRIVLGLQDVQRRYFYHVQASMRHRGRYYHEHQVEIDVDTSDGPRIADDDAAGVADLLRDVMRWVYRALEKEWEYQNADEQVDETIKANEYEFDEDGGRA